MSKYGVTQTVLREEKYLVEALKEMGYEVEVHPEGVQLNSYYSEQEANLQERRRREEDQHALDPLCCLAAMGGNRGRIREQRQIPVRRRKTPVKELRGLRGPEARCDGSSRHHAQVPGAVKERARSQGGRNLEGLGAGRGKRESLQRAGKRGH